MAKAAKTRAGSTASSAGRPSTDAATDGKSDNRSASIWHPEDDEILSSARAQGLNWAPIAVRYFPTKTANACRKRHERLMERRHSNDWERQRLESLASTYMEMRQEIWSGLAERLGERSWQLVEAKCMEQGLKNLQTVSRSSRKRKASEDLDGEEDHEGDSGVGLSDAEADPGRTENRRPAHVRTNTASTIIHPQYPSQLVPQSQPQSQPQLRPLAAADQRTKRTLVPLPLYEPPASAWLARPQYPVLPPCPAAFERYYPRPRSADAQQQRGNISVQSMLLPPMNMSRH